MPSITESAINFVISPMDFNASSLPGIGTLILLGSLFVSTMATIGTPSFKASLTALNSISVSTIKITAGIFSMPIKPPKNFFNFFNLVAITCSSLFVLF